MLTLSITMFAAAAVLPTFNLPPAKSDARARCADDCARRYRLPSADAAPLSAKYRALREDGVDCNVTRSRICRSQPRTWV